MTIEDDGTKIAIFVVLQLKRSKKPFFAPVLLMYPKGRRFTVFASVEKQLSLPPKCDQAVNPTGRILIIDDDHSVLFALKRIFRSPSIIADTCDSLESAKYCLDNNRYQLVLTDLDFCKNVQDAGIEICAYIKSTLPNVKVILWTGSTQCEALNRKAEAAKVDFLFQKPLSPQIIKKIIENLYFWG